MSEILHIHLNSIYLKYTYVLYSVIKKKAAHDKCAAFGIIRLSVSRGLSDDNLLVVDDV